MQAIDPLQLVDCEQLQRPALGPFEPPTDYEYEAELVGPAPRPISPEFRRASPHVIQQNAIVWGCLYGGTAAIVLAKLPFVMTLGIYLLPLQYLFWIGLVVILAGVATWITAKTRRQPWDYVQTGTPTVGRVTELTLTPTVIYNGQPTQYAFVAEVEFRSPATNELTRRSCQSKPVRTSDGWTTSFRVGDYVTLIFLPNRLEQTLQLYSFLNLRAGTGIVRRDGQPTNSPWSIVLGITALIAMFAVLFWNVYAYGRYTPCIEGISWLQIPFAAGVVLLGIPTMAWLAWQVKRTKQRSAARSAEALRTGEAVEWDPGAAAGWFGVRGWIMGIVVVAGSLLIGGLTATCWAMTANAWLDRSPATQRDIVIDQMVMVTHSLLLREYKIEYRFPDSPKKYEFLSTPDHLAQFVNEKAVAHVREGRFGWPWIETIEP